MPKLKSVPRLLPYGQSAAAPKRMKGVIPHYFVARQCPICLERAQTIQDSTPICADCEQDPNQVAKRLSQWICIWDNRLRDLDQGITNMNSLPTYAFAHFFFFNICTFFPLFPISCSEVLFEFKNFPY